MKYKSLENLIISLFVIISIFIFFKQYTDHNFYPGDTGDTRFSTYILEYFYQSLFSKELKFDTLNYLYPLQGNIFFSETMWGSAWIYTIYRVLQYSIEVSYTYYFISIFLLNFLSSFYVLKKFKLSFFSNIFGSYLFTFGLPIIAQDAHPQLFFRIAVPFGFYFFFLFLNNRKSYQLFFSIFFLLIQTLSSIYTGFFLGTLYLVMIITNDLNFSNYKFGAKSFKNYLYELKKNLDFINDNKLINFLSVLLILILIYYLYQYYLISNLYSYGRPYPFTHLINIFSFFTTDRSIIFPEILPSIYPLHEQQLYLGISIFIILFFLLKYKVYQSSETLHNQILKFIISNVLLFFGILGISLYILIYLIPGVSGIRAPCRSIVVIIFPISIYLGFIIDNLNKHMIVWRYNIFKFLILFLLLFETISAKKTSSDISVEQNKVKEILQKIDTEATNKIIVYKNNGNLFDDYYTDIKVSFAALSKNLLTLNGYTSFVPDFYRPFVSCNDVVKYISDLNKFNLLNNITNQNLSLDDLLFVGFENNCSEIKNN